MSRPSAALGGTLLGAGSTLLVGAFAPYLPGGSRLGAPGTAVLGNASLVAGGLLLALAGAMALAVARPVAGSPLQGSRGSPAAGTASIGAALASAAIGAVAASRAGSALWTPVPTDPVDRLLLVGAIGSLLTMPALLWLILGRSPQIPADRPGPGLGRVVLVALLATFGATVLLGVVQNAPFSWDESVYALTARHWVHGTPDTGWGVHRPPLLPALGVLPAALDAGEAQFRIIGLAFGVAAVLAAWWLGRSLGGGWTGLAAAMAVVAAPTIQIDSGLLLNDVPAMAVILCLMAVAVRQLESPAPIGWGILWLAPMAALAFYLRYGSVLALVAIGLAATVIWPRRLLEAWPPLLTSVLLLLLLVLPHVAFAIAQTGSPLGIFLLAQSGAAGAYPGAGLVQYLEWLPSGLVGPLPGALAVLGLVGGAYRLGMAARRRSWDPGARGAALLLIPALLMVGVLGIFQLPQARYLFLPMVLLVIAGAWALVDLARSRGAPGRALGVVTAALLAVALVESAASMPARADARAAAYEWLRDAGTWIRDDGPGSCSILASDVPQLTWYSGCATYNFGDTSRPGRDALLSGERRYLVIRRDGRFQPPASVLGEYLSRVEPQAVAMFQNRDGIVVGTVYRFIRD